MSTELDNCLGLQARRKVHASQEATAQIGLEEQVMTAIAEAEAAGETGNYCTAVAVAADCEFGV